MVDNVSPWSQTSPFQTPSPTMTKPEEIPYHWLPGSPEPSAAEQAAKSISSDPIKDTVDAFFPFYDGDTNTPPASVASPPEGFDSDPDDLLPNTFLKWHSMFQLQYINEHGSGTPKTVVLHGADGATMTGVRLKGGTMVGVLEHMQKNDFAKLSLEDQEAVAALEAFKSPEGIALRLNLLPREGATVQVGNTTMDASTSDNARAALVAMATAAKATMTAVGGTLLTDEICDIFRREIDNLALGRDDTSVTPTVHHAGRLENAGIFSEVEFSKQLREIVSRFERVKAFGTVPPENQYQDVWRTSPLNSNTTSEASGYYFGVTSLDNGATIRSGFEKFVEQERRLLALDNAKLDVVRAGSLENKKLDLPNLVFLLQLNYNLIAEAKVTADTEEINQQNALLQIYGQMQQLVNGVSKVFGTDQEQTINVNSSDDLQRIDSLPTSMRKLVSMFEDYFATNGVGNSGTRVAHPIETLRGITRPLQDMVRQSNGDINQRDLINEFRKTQWDSFNTQLSDTVTLINQENQIKMNDINSMNKQKDRHFDLANGALSKMFDTIQNIARATGN